MMLPPLSAKCPGRHLPTLSRPPCDTPRRTFPVCASNTPALGAACACTGHAGAGAAYGAVTPDPRPRGTWRSHVLRFDVASLQSAIARQGMDLVSGERHGTRGKDFRVFVVARKPA